MSLKYVVEFYQGIKKGLAYDLDSLFLYAKLVFIKRVEDADNFERAFAFHFYGIDIPAVKEGDPELLYTQQFRDWLKEAIDKGELPKHPQWELGLEELTRRFWDTLKKQMEAHHGGSKWIGTGGSSPFGHSGQATKGIRMYGESQNRSAVKVIGQRRYVDYSSSNSLKGDNIRQALSLMKNMLPAGAYSQLDVDETIRKTARNGGEIELIFSREVLDKIKVVLLLDNGGSSMMPWVDLCRLLFSKMKDRFREFTPYYFHNSIYGNLYKDPQRLNPLPTDKLLLLSPETRVFIVGDASMAPEELYRPKGSIYMDANDDEESSLVWLTRLKNRFSHLVWLNPIAEHEWDITYGNWTIQKISQIIHMEDLSLKGIKKAVEYLANR